MLLSKYMPHWAHPRTITHGARVSASRQTAVSFLPPPCLLLFILHRADGRFPWSINPVRSLPSLTPCAAFSLGFRLNPKWLPWSDPAIPSWVFLCAFQAFCPFSHTHSHLKTTTPATQMVRSVPPSGLCALPTLLRAAAHMAQPHRLPWSCSALFPPQPTASPLTMLSFILLGHTEKLQVLMFVCCICSWSPSDYKVVTSRGLRLRWYFFPSGKEPRRIQMNMPLPCNHHQQKKSYAEKCEHIQLYTFIWIYINTHI